MPETSSQTVLIIDDDAAMRDSLGNLFDRAGWQTIMLASGRALDGHLANSKVDVIISDLSMPDVDGMQVLQGLPPDGPPLILITAFGDVDKAVEAMTAGAYTFLEKPFDPRRLLLAARHAAEQSNLRRENDRLRERLNALSGLDTVLLGTSDRLTKIRSDIVNFADQRAPVLISGPTGAGKSLVAQSLHTLSEQETSEPSLLDATVTSDDQAKEIMADLEGKPSATLIIENIEAFSTAAQAALQRLLENSEQSPRVIAISNLPVSELGTHDQLRQELFHRLNHVLIDLPPLNALKKDLPLLATHFIAVFEQTHQTNAAPLSVADQTSLLSHTWPGNMRELRNVMERYVLMSRQGSVALEEVLNPSTTPSKPKKLRQAVEDFERDLIANALSRAEGKMDDIAAELGIGRRTLNEKIVKLGLKTKD